MGTINNEVMILVGNHLDRVAEKARALLFDPKEDLSYLVGAPIKAINGVETLVIASSGSKVGWGRAEALEAAHSALIVWLSEQKDCWAEWTIVKFWEETGDQTFVTPKGEAFVSGDNDDL